MLGTLQQNMKLDGTLANSLKMLVSNSCDEIRKHGEVALGL